MSSWIVLPDFRYCKDCLKEAKPLSTLRWHSIAQRYQRKISLYKHWIDRSEISKKIILPITGMPQGPGGKLEKVCCHIRDFPVRNKQTRKQRNRTCPVVEKSSNEKLMVNQTGFAIVDLVRFSSVATCLSGVVASSRPIGHKRERLGYKYANKLFTPHWTLI